MMEDERASKDRIMRMRSGLKLNLRRGGKGREII
jgi:hypothetical protein